MIILISKDEAPPMMLTGKLALSFWRAYRGELWSQGIKRDPIAGDCLLGVKILTLIA